MTVRKRTGNLIPAVAVTVMLITGSMTALPVLADTDGNLSGGGYSASGQVNNAGYTPILYDDSNGLPTSDINYILSASDGYIWVGGYSGIMRYDGKTFTRIGASDGLTSGRALFEDSKGRIWVGTNDNGVVVIDGDDKTHLTYKEGLPSSSIRSFAEDTEGNIFIGTTAGICYADPEFAIHSLNETALEEERVLRLDKDSEGRIYGQTKNGLIFLIEDQSVSKIFSSEELNMEKISTIKADPKNPGKLYIGTEGDKVYYGRFGDHAQNMVCIPVGPLSGVHWISYDCNRIWVSSIGAAGYIDDNYRFRMMDNLPMDSGIEMTTSDYQGNLWFASSTQGVMKIVTSIFVDVSNKAGLPKEVVNAACFYRNNLYVGTDHGIRVIDSHEEKVESEIPRFVGDTRVRCIVNGIDDDLWVGTYTLGKGLIHYSRDGKITSYTTENGMPDNEIRCIRVTDDGTVLVGTNGGLAVIKEGKVVKTFGAAEGIDNTTFLTVEAGDNGRIYVGTDGDGIYEINGNDIRQIGRDDGLTSDVIVRIKKDETKGLYWLITSNSIEYMKDGVITNVTSFPYNNVYDMYYGDDDNMWITSSYGIFTVNASNIVNNAVSDYGLYTTYNGLFGTPTSYGYCALNDGYLYIPERNGICKVNTDHITKPDIQIKTTIESVYCGDELIMPDADGVYTMPRYAGRIKITAAVLDYTQLNPDVQMYMEGKEDEGISVKRSDLQPLEYTGLEYGDYDLHIRITDSESGQEISDNTFRFVKKARLAELPLVRAALFVLVALIAGVAVWRFLKITVIRKQYDALKRARDDAERANSAKSRFLANISHEIRTPINTIMGMNEMVMREDATGVPKPYFMSMMNYAFDIRSASESLLSLINDLLDMSKIESGKMHLVEQEYDTQEMLRTVVSMIRVRSTEKELTFDVDVDEMLPSRMYGDQGKIKQIILNLLTNAVKYTDSGGFALSVSMDEREDKDCKLRFSVKDTGIGVKEEDMEKLFSAYERLDEQKNSGIQGTGLGLDISRRFAELMGGSLKCESEYGKGSEFILNVTQKIIDPTPVGVFMEHDDSNAKGPYVPLFIAPDADVLVVDDNPVNLNVIKGLLKGTRVFVSTASSGEECLEKIKDTRFDVVLLDHMMPGMDGVETLAEIRKSDPELPVYALTANSSAGEDYYLSRGFNGYLSKPVDSRVLEKTIMKHLPEDIMEQPTEEDAVEELKEIPEDLLWIYDTEGISVPDGIKNSGGIANYIFSLNLFLDTIDNNAKVIRDAYDSANIRLFTIKVHSLKSSAKIIGAMGLSKLCADMEDAGNREDMDYIKDNTDRLLVEYEEYKDKLERLHAGDGDAGKEMIPDKELTSAYNALADVIPQMDYDSVEMILDRLSDYALPPEDDEAVKQLRKMLRNFEWDKMEDVIACRQKG